MTRRADRLAFAAVVVGALTVGPDDLRWTWSEACIAGEHSRCRHPAYLRRGDGCSCACHTDQVTGLSAP